MIVTWGEKTQTVKRSRGVQHRGYSQRQGQTLADHLTDAAIQLDGDRYVRVRGTLCDGIRSSPGEGRQRVLMDGGQRKQVDL